VIKLKELLTEQKIDINSIKKYIDKYKISVKTYSTGRQHGSTGSAVNNLVVVTKNGKLEIGDKASDLYKSDGGSSYRYLNSYDRNELDKAFKDLKRIG
tara:strand:+ start:38 stop:331 length:294 start_codon:yes stop_codon:yes gene_type:complete